MWVGLAVSLRSPTAYFNDVGLRDKAANPTLYLRIRVFCSSFTQGFQYFLPQRLRCDDLHFRTMFEYIHHQFARVGVRDAHS